MNTCVPAEAADRQPMKVGLAAFTADHFVGRVGEVFRLMPSVESPDASCAPYEVELIDVRRSGKPRAASGAILREPFALLFTLRSRVPLEAGLHRLVHDVFASDDLFLSRVVVPGRDPRAIYYEAVFG
ncbi:MAG TPA: hypothetical protein VGJ39_10885 [Vicinamibacterales bacterium]|jgi:hypothetical protein